MINFNIESDTKSIKVKEFVSFRALEAIKWLKEHGNIDTSDYYMAVIRYDCSKGLDFELSREDAFPLKFKAVDGTALLVTGVTAGYGGEGPHTLCEILIELGFELSEEDEQYLCSNECRSKDGKVFVTFSKRR